VGPMDRPTGPVGLTQARMYVVSLINRDRSEAGLEPVDYDATAEKGGQLHTEDMVAHGFTAHWGTDGSVPEQRYSEAGGVEFVQENAACFFDGVERQLDPNPTFDATSLEQIESAFINELPPNDGHKKNILKKWHTAVGIGLGKPAGVDQPCMTQEFVDHYGSYDALPAEAKVGAKISVSGEVQSPAEFGGVGIGRIDAARPRTARDLNATNSYPVPEPYAVYFPAGFKTPKPVTVKGNHFSIDLSLDQGPGRYEISVWGRFPDNKAFVMVSLRTIHVR